MISHVHAALDGNSRISWREQDALAMHELPNLQLMLAGIILLRPVEFYNTLRYLNF